MVQFRTKSREGVGTKCFINGVICSLTLGPPDFYPSVDAKHTHTDLRKPSLKQGLCLQLTSCAGQTYVNITAFNLPFHL